MHKVLLIFLSLSCLLTLEAQRSEDIKLTLGGGFLLKSASDNLGMFLQVEPKMKSTKNTYIGLRVGFVLNPQKFDNYDITQFKIDEASDNGGVAFVSTFEYYFSDDDFRPFVGAGLGAYLLSDYVDVTRARILNPAADVYQVDVKYQLGAMLRLGFESTKTRVGLEYNLLQKADLKIPDGQVIGTVDNSYLGLSLGFIIGAW